MKQSWSSMLPKEMPIIKPEPLCSCREDWRRLLDEMYRRYRTQIEKNGVHGQLDLDRVMLKRRTRVLLDSIEQIEQRFSELGKFFPDKNVLGKTWLWLNIPFLTYSHLESKSYMLYAASIWILDQIDDYEVLSNLLRLHPIDQRIVEELNFPDAWDSQNDELLICFVMQILFSRHTNLKEPEYDPDTKSRKVFTDSINAVGKQMESCPSMDLFRELLAMLPTESIQKAVSNFRDKAWAWIDRYFHCQFPMIKAVKTAEEKNHQARTRYNKLRADFVDLMKNIEKMYRSQKEETQPTRAGSPAINPQIPHTNVMPFAYGFSNKNSSGQFHPSTRFSQYEQKATQLAHELNCLSETIDALNSEVVKTRQKYQDFWTQLMYFGVISREQASNDYGDAVADAIAPLEIENPYELCFALLYLIEDGDDLPWLYGVGIGFMQEVISSLPWGIYPYNKLEETANCNGLISPILENNLFVKTTFERRYQYKGNEQEDAVPRNLAQIVYEETGCLLPRNLRNYESAVQRMRLYGVQEKEIENTICCLSSIANGREKHKVNSLKSCVLQLLQDDNNISKTCQDSPTYDELSIRVQQQKEQIKVLQTSLHEAKRNELSITKEFQRYREKATLEHRELADLRERFFLSETSEEISDDTASEEDFPYEVERDTLVFGGHANWGKAIRQLLTGKIRFIDKDKSFDSGIIRYADIIWIQTNALSHSMFYTVIDEARKLNKPIRYFLFSGAVKCAIQIMEEDQVQII